MEKINDKQNPSCVGLDPRIADIPQEIKASAAQKHGNNFLGAAQAIIEFNSRIIDAVSDIVPAVKPQIAFYECYGSAGVYAYIETINYAKKKGLAVIGDVKRGDIGSTAQAYADGHLGSVTLPESISESPMHADAITVNPYPGSDSVQPFIDVCRNNGKGIFVLCKTSNPSSADIQDIDIGSGVIYEKVAQLISKWAAGTEGSSGYSFVGAVVGATYPEQALAIRKIIRNSFFLVPGYGAQGGDAEQITNCFNKDGYGAIVNSARGIIFAYKKTAKDVGEAAAEAAEKMKEDIAGAMKAEGIYPW